MKLTPAIASAVVFFLTLVSCHRKATPITEHSRLPRVLSEFNAGKTDAPIPDFSYAGYHSGSGKLAVKRDMKYYSVVEYGAVPDDGNDDVEAIQRAIDAAGAAGGGIVVFPSGTFDFDVRTSRTFLKMKYSNVVLRGNGSNIEGTVLYDHSPSSYPDPKKKWLAATWPSFIFAGPLPSDSAWHLDSRKMNALTEVRESKRFSMSIEVDDSRNLEVGKSYLLTQHDPDSSLAFSLVYPAKKLAANYLNPAQPYRFQNIITIRAIEGNKVALSATLMWDLKKHWQPQLWPLPAMVSEIGIEGIRFRTDWAEPFIHHYNSTHDNGWDHIRFSFVRDGWVRNVVCENATTGVSLHSSTHCLVTDTQIVGNPGHNGFGINGLSTYNLVQNVIGGRAMHTYTIQGYVSGNVFQNCYSDEPSSIDGHGGLGPYNLFDNIYGAVFQNGGSNSAIPPAMGKNVFWNWQMGVQNPYNGRVKPLIAKFGLIQGFVAVGVKGGRGQTVFFEDGNGQKIYTDHHSEWARIESLNEKVEPSSLYLYQLEKRRTLLQKATNTDGK